MKRLPIFILSALMAACVNPSSTANKGKVVATMAGQVATKFSRITHLSVEEVKNRQSRGEKIILVDVREKKETDVSIIPGAITMAEFKLQQERYRDYTVVTYCTIGYRSSQSAEKLEDMGFNAYNLKGSVLAWAHAGGGFEHAGKKTKKVHVYAEAWNLLPEGYEAVYE